jgi:hypothetical protein
VGDGEGVVSATVVDTGVDVGSLRGVLVVGCGATLHAASAVIITAISGMRIRVSVRRRASTSRNMPLLSDGWCLARWREELPDYTPSPPLLHLMEVSRLLVLSTAMGYD